MFTPMKVMLVRHGQSTNNIIHERINPLLQSGKITQSEHQDIWLRERTDDPPLSEKGLQEAEQLGAYYGAMFRRDRVRSKLYCSAMHRACQTIRPLSRHLNDQQVVVRPDIFEAGGIYSSDGGKPPSRVVGKTHTAAELKALFPPYDVSSIEVPSPASTVAPLMWYDAGFEDAVRADARAASVAAWLKSGQLRKEVGEGVQMVMVSHADFLNQMLRKLFETKNTNFAFANTSTAMLNIFPSGDVTVDWLVRVDHLISSKM
jgi:broad specificity phosphatase PhoE